MRTSIATVIVLSTFGISFALAQGTVGSGSSLNSPGMSSPDTRGIPPAPVGHRQPRLDQVPAAAENAYKESPEDKALDRKIKSICRGC